MVRICGDDILNGSHVVSSSGLIKLDRIDCVFKNFSWDIQEQDGFPGFEENSKGYTYKSKKIDDWLEPLFYYRRTHGIINDYRELSQELILLNNLFWNEQKKKYYSIQANGELEEVIYYTEESNIFIKRKYLFKYLAAKQMALLLFFDFRFDKQGQLTDYNLNKFSKSFKNDNYYFQVWVNENKATNQIVSVLMGKKILFPPSIEKCGFWPYEKEITYESFIIGSDEFGNEIRHSCNPDTLSNNFSDNVKDSCHYLTPVIFRKEVLEKYYNHELYEITSGYLHCKSKWGLLMDNHHKDCVIVYLGDLGNSLPEQEQIYWKSYNITEKVTLSEVAIKRDFFNEFTSSITQDHIFQSNYRIINEKWEKVFGWKLFLPLTKNDKYIYSAIRLPLSENQSEFDNLV